jgi:eukaryotic-like serine/threonine-protein kinase
LGDSSFIETGQGALSRPKPGDLIADKYQVERFIGQGGMAEVYAGLNIRTGKRVALKWISPALARTKEALSRFRREALAAGRINHPNVVTVFDVVEHMSSTWLVMELLEGDPLSEILNRVGYMEPEPAVQLLIPAIRGVAAAHAHGVIHRDLTPDNIFICRSADGKPREAKVLDFGVSKLADDASDQVGITGLGHAVGTPAYMAPEQIRGNITTDARTDVYALGVVLYQMLAGRRPFDGQIYSALMIQIATTDPPRLRTVQPHIPVALDEIVHRALARDMDKRFPDVKTLLEALEDLVHVDVSYAPNKISTGHSGRMPLSGNERERVDVSYPSRVVPVFGTATGDAASRFASSPLNLPPMTPPAGSIPVEEGGWAAAHSLHRVIPIVAALGLVAAVIALAVVRARHELPREEIAVAPPRAIAPPPSRPTAPVLGELVVVVTPPAAKITIDGVPVDGNPYTGHYRKDLVHEVGASAVGYEPKTQRVVLAKDLTVNLSLDRKKAMSTWPPPLARGEAVRRPVDARRIASRPGAPGNLAPGSEIATARSGENVAPPSASPSQMIISPAGGHAPIHPILTASPYEKQ